jgi:hypothetical protein
MVTARTGARGLALVACLGLLLLATAAWAQEEGGIAGVARDPSGAVLPGVSVEVASPALIEKVRTATTDGEGRFSITNLPVGTYTVTFTLEGFTTFRREGITLTTGFTATVNGDLRVGTLAETITVSGQAPIVDTQTTRQQEVLTSAILNTMPSGNTSYATLVVVTPGFQGSLADVGGTKDTWAAQGGYTFFHGKPGTRASFDGMRNQYFVNSGPGAGYVVNPDAVAEFQLETTGMGVEAASGSTSLNAVPREGSNVFTLGLNGTLSTSGMQGNNLTSDLIARGLTTAPHVNKIYRDGFQFGGPIELDKLWIFGAIGYWGKSVNVGGAYHDATEGSFKYTPDLTQPAADYDWYRTHSARLTWQASPKNKVTFYGDIQQNCRCTTGFTGSSAIESQVGWNDWPSGIVQGTWSYPVTSKLLLQAGGSWQVIQWANFNQPGVSTDYPSILEESTNFRYNAPAQLDAPQARTGRSTVMFKASYITGTHAFKLGVTDEAGFTDNGIVRDGPFGGLGYNVLNGVPVQLTYYALPYLQKDRMKAEVGLFASDNWRIKRLTLNLGIRYDYLNGYVPAINLPAGPYVGQRTFAEIDDAPRWKDWDPRVGASWDIFGDGKTAVKVSMGRYVSLSGADLTGLLDPMASSINTAFRSWTDTNGNGIPDCNLANNSPNGECGPISNVFFGTTNPKATVYSDSLRYGNRLYTWDFTTELQRELFTGLEANVSYNYNWDRNFRITDNLVDSPSQYTPYCVTAPKDPRLPNGGGYQICSNYDLNPALFGQGVTSVQLDSDLGDRQVRQYKGVDFALNGRVGKDLRLGAGVATGNALTDTCFVVNSPQGTASTVAVGANGAGGGLQNCHVVTPWQGLTDFRMNASYTLPRDIVVGALYQNRPGPPITATWAAPQSAITPSLGRNLAGNPGFALIPLIVPGTDFDGRYTQLDLRLSKSFHMGPRIRLQGNIDLYNALNSNSTATAVTAGTVLNVTYGPSWLRPNAIVDARLLQLSGKLFF